MSKECEERKKDILFILLRDKTRIYATDTTTLRTEFYGHFLLQCSTYLFVDSSNGEAEINLSERETLKVGCNETKKDQQAMLRPSLHEKEMYLACAVDDKYSADSIFLFSIYDVTKKKIFIDNVPVFTRREIALFPRVHLTCSETKRNTY